MNKLSNKVTCKYCNCSDFFIQSGFYHCSNCFVSQGHVLGYYDKAENERFYFRKNLFIKENITTLTK